jgi:hypothetical protein
MARWALAIPTAVLLARMLLYHAPTSVLAGSSITAIRYFFDIQKVMPTFADPLSSDPVRVWAQMSVTAPFYAGIAYSLGALASKHQLLTKLFAFEKHDELHVYEKAVLRTANGRPSTEPDESMSAVQLPTNGMFTLATDVPSRAGSKDLNASGRADVEN